MGWALKELSGIGLGDKRLDKRAAALLDSLAAYAEAVPSTRLVYVADREADILGSMRRAHAPGNPADWLVRAAPDRKLG